MHGEDDEWGVAADGLPSGRSRAPRPDELTELRSPAAFETLARVGWVARAKLSVELAGNWIGACYRAEIEAGNTFVWSVAALCGGAAAYFALPHEPSFLALSLSACIAIAGIVFARLRTGLPFPAM